jgi:hypothetical protein
MKAFILIIFSLFLFDATSQIPYNKLEKLKVSDIVAKKLSVESTTIGSIPCPVMTNSQMEAIGLPLSGSCVFNTNTDKLHVYDGSAWVEVGSGGGAGGGISNWETAKLYKVNDVVIESLKIYQCNTEHTSGVFATDIAKWDLISGVTLGDATGLLDASKIGSADVDNTEFGYLNNVTSSIQTQLNSKEPTITTLPIAKGGTNSSTALSGQTIMVSDGTKIVQGPAGTTSTVLHGNASGAPSYSAVSLTGDVSGVLPLANGGTNKNMTAVNGGIIYTDADSQEVLAAGANGQVLQSNGASPPSWVNKSISGKSEENTSVSVEEIQTPNWQLTNTADGKYLIETGNSNLLNNPSFEDKFFDSGWTQTVGSLSEETTIKIHGKKSYKATLSSQTLNIYQDSTLYASQFADGVQGVAWVRVKTSLSGISVCSRNAGVTSTNCASVNNDNKWMLYKVPFVLGGTSNGIAIVSSGSITGEVIIDDAYVGTDAGIADVSTCNDVNCETEFSLQASNAGAVLSENLDWIASSSVTDTSRYSYTFTSGIFTVAPSCVVSAEQGSTTGALAKIESITATAVTVRLYNSPNTNLANPHKIICQKQGVDYLNAKARASGQVFATNCGANCENVFSAKVSITGAVSSENLDFINSCSLATSTFTCTFNSGVFTVPPVCSLVTNSGSASAVRINAATTSSQLQATTFTTTTAAATAYAFEVICQKQGADYTSSRQIIGSFKEVVTAPGINKPKTCYASYGGASATLASPTVCSTGTCVEVEDTCGVFTPPSFTVTGNYSGLTIANGAFANNSSITCDCKSFSTTTGIVSQCETAFKTSGQTWSTNSSGGGVWDIWSFGSTGGSANSYFRVRCEGQAP